MGDGDDLGLRPAHQAALCVPVRRRPLVCTGACLPVAFEYPPLVPVSVRVCPLPNLGTSVHAPVQPVSGVAVPLWTCSHVCPCPPDGEHVDSLGGGCVHTHVAVLENVCEVERCVWLWAGMKQVQR